MNLNKLLKELLMLCVILSKKNVFLFLLYGNCIDKTRRNVVYDWNFTMNQKLNLNLSTIADEFVNTILTFIDTLNQ